MLRFIKRRLSSGKDDSDQVSNQRVALHGKRASDLYFETMSAMQAAISSRHYEAAARLVRENLSYIPQWVMETRRQYGSFDIPSIPSLDQGGKILALTGDDEGISEMASIVGSVPELEGWTSKVDQHRYDLALFEKITAAVEANPRCLQTDLKTLVVENDGRRIANLVSYLEKSGALVRIRDGRTYRLLSSDSPDAPVAVPTPTVGSHRQDTEAARCRSLDISSLEYVPLPRSPSRWEEKLASREKVNGTASSDHFEIRDADWRIVDVYAIPNGDRADPAFRRFYPKRRGSLMIDDLGKAAGLGDIQSAALRYDEAGNQVAKKGLQHGIYRIGVHPVGNGFIAMSADCVIHAYNDELEPLFATSLAEAPEIIAIKRRLNFENNRLRNFVRCVASSRSSERYLFTVVDEAWCVDFRGSGLWGVRFPIAEGWTELPASNQLPGTSVQVAQALDLMGLKLPITPETVRHRYRELAKEYHPDLNADRELSEERMKAINLAAELLTGVDVSGLSEISGTQFVRDQRSFEMEFGHSVATATMQLVGDETSATDWIYAAAFAARSDSVYLAGYSGRVVLVSAEGTGTIVYDVGSVPKRIIDTGDYLYLLTDTRLYVLRDNALHAIVDTFEGGDLAVAPTGFALIEPKRLRWFEPGGRYVGAVVSSDPIRVAHFNRGELILETRRRRAVVQGVAKEEHAAGI